MVNEVCEGLALLEREPGLWEDAVEGGVSVASFARTKTGKRQSTLDRLAQDHRAYFRTP